MVKSQTETDQYLTRITQIGDRYTYCVILRGKHKVIILPFNTLIPPIYQTSRLPFGRWWHYCEPRKFYCSVIDIQNSFSESASNTPVQINRY